MRAFTLFLLAMPSIAHAQTAEIVVTGAALPYAIGDAAYDIATIDRARLTSLASGNIEDALRDISGLQQFRRSDSRSANATSQGATLRGLGGNASSRALLILDGVPQSDPFGGWVTWPAYSVARLGEIRVTRGGGSGSAGPGALAGTIEMTSIRAGASNGIGGSLSYGSRNAIEGDLTLGGKIGSGSAQLSASYARGDGFIPIIDSQRGPADRPAPYEQTSIAARIVAPLSAETEIQAATSAFTDQRNRGLAFTRNGGRGADASLRLVHQGAWQWQALAYVQMRNFNSQAASVDDARTLSTQTLDQYNVPSTGIGAHFELRPPLGESFSLRIGGDWRRTSGETREFFSYVTGNPTRGRLAGGESDTIGTFIEASHKSGDLTLTSGARIDHWSINDGHLSERILATGAITRDDRYDTRQGWEPTGRLGIAYDTGSITLRSAAYLGWRLPTLNELYRPFRIGNDSTAANAALNPERLKGIEAGLAWQPSARVSLQATAFSNRLDGAIANVTISSTATSANRQRQNLDAIDSKGIELDGHLTLGDWHLSASYAYTDARVISNGIAIALNALRPAQVARHSASATLDFKWLSATLRTISSQFEDDQNKRQLRGAVTLDAVANIPLTNGLTLTLRGENLTDTQIDTAISATSVIERASPRTIWMGLRVQ